MRKTDTNKLLGDDTTEDPQGASNIDDDITKQVQKAAPEIDTDTTKVGLLIDGRYQITGLVGRGGMGSVYKAEHTGIRRTVAIKLLHQTLSAVPEVIRRFEREAFAIGRIEHPNCVNVTDFGKLEDGSLYLVMEYLEGTSLGDLLAQQRRIKPADALHIIRHVVRGLGHAHQADIVHRDVKPENVLLIDNEGDPLFAKILDFGVAKLIGEAHDDDSLKLTQAGVAFGTPVYMSPEQAMGNPVDGRADLYAATIMLYEMITGQPPFKSHDKLEILSMHATRKPRPLKQVVGNDVELPPGLQELIDKGLEKRPQHRFADADEYIAAIDDVLAGRGPKRTAKRAGTVPLLYGQDPLLSTGATPHATSGVVLPAHTPAWWQSRKFFAAMAALVFVSIVTVVAVLATRSGSGGSDEPEMSALATQADAAKADPAKVIELLRDKADAIANDTDALLLLGHAYAQTNNPQAAMTAYRRALKLEEDKAASNPGLRANLVTWAESEQNTRVRHAAWEMAKKYGFGDKVDVYKAYVSDLRYSPGCKNRRKAIPKLVKLGDKRAINELYEAKIRRGTRGHYKGKRLNRCLVKEANEAMMKLRELNEPDAGPGDNK